MIREGSCEWGKVRRVWKKGGANAFLYLFFPSSFSFLSLLPLFNFLFHIFLSIVNYWLFFYSLSLPIVIFFRRLDIYAVLLEFCDRCLHRSSQNCDLASPPLLKNCVFRDLEVYGLDKTLTGCSIKKKKNHFPCGILRFFLYHPYYCNQKMKKEKEKPFNENEWVQLQPDARSWFLKLNFEICRSLYLENLT